MVTGFMAAGLSGRGRAGLAIRQLEAIHRANGLAGWRFPEFLHGRTLEPMGVPHMLWSAAGAVLAHQAVKGRGPFDAILTG